MPRVYRKNVVNEEDAKTNQIKNNYVSESGFLVLITRRVVYEIRWKSERRLAGQQNCRSTYELEHVMPRQINGIRNSKGIIMRLCVRVRVCQYVSYSKAEEWRQ